MNHTNSQSVLDKIKAENIKPRSKWYFVAYHAALWVPGVIVTLIGSVSVAGGLYSYVHAGWEYQDFIYKTPTDFLLDALPLLWIGSFIFFGSVIVYALRTTPRGYRLSTRKILIASFLASVALGSAMYVADEYFKANSIIRYPVHMREEGIWFSTSSNRIAGLIQGVSDDQLLIVDNKNNLWTVDMSGFGSTTFPFVQTGENIRIIGTTTDDHVFIACQVFPWDIGNFDRPEPPQNTQPSKLSQLIVRHQKNKNPDCVMLLHDIRERVRGM